jgi:hypothetical protein
VHNINQLHHNPFNLASTHHTSVFDFLRGVERTLDHQVAEMSIDVDVLVLLGGARRGYLTLLTIGRFPT